MSVGTGGELYEEWLELRNGCLCCSVKDNGVKAIEELMKKKGRFDYVLLETTGLADPGPIASIFWMDEALGSDLYLDGIVTVIDAKYGLQKLNEKPDEGFFSAAVRQVALADFIILNKKDLVSEQELEKIQQSIRSINCEATLHTTEYCRVDLNSILDIGAYSGTNSERLRKVASDTERLLAFTPTHLTESVGTISLVVPTPWSCEKLEQFLQTVLWEDNGINDRASEKMYKVWRLKGLVFTDDEAIHVQAVNETYDCTPVPISQVDEESKKKERTSRLVLIGSNLQEKMFYDVLTMIN